MSESPHQKTPGERIAEARRARGLSLDDLAERTKIPTSMLLALEADEYHRLSGPIYARSFLRTCARELGLDADDILASYARDGGDAVHAVGESGHVDEPVRIRRVGLPWLRLGLTALVAIAVGVTAFVLTGRERDGQLSAGPLQASRAAREAPDAVDPSRATRASSTVDPAVMTALPTGSGTMVAADRDLPAGVPGLAFQDGLTWPLVVRLCTTSPLAARARRDGEAAFTDVRWPGTVAAEAIPADGIEAGRGYAAAGQLVVYWGAVDRLSLILGSAEGVELTVNGEPRAVRAPPGGGDVVIDLSATAAAQLP